MTDTFIKKNDNFILDTKGLPYIFLGKNWEGRVVYHPQIIKKDKQYYLFYTGTTSIQKICFRHDIGVVISNDLKNWTRYNNNPILSPGASDEWDGGLVAHSYIIKKDNLYYMFYDGSPEKQWQEEIGLAISDNLIHWEKYENNPVLKTSDFWWDKDHVSRCCVFSEGGRYYMFFAGHNGRCERIGLAISDDLFHWKKQGSEPVLNLGKQGDWDEFHISDPKIIKVDNTFLMFYTGYDSKKKKGRIGLALSNDLINWHKFKKNPILDVGKPGSWDCNEACRADIFQDGEQYYVVYSGRKGFRFRVGLARLDMKELLSAIQRYAT